MLDQRRELLRVGVEIAPVAKDHRDRRPAAERVGLRYERDIDGRGGLSERQNRQEREDHRYFARSTMMMTTSRMMMIVVAVRATVVTPPTSS